MRHARRGVNQPINQRFYSLGGPQLGGQLARLTKLRSFIRKQNRQNVIRYLNTLITNEASSENYEAFVTVQSKLKATNCVDRTSCYPVHAFMGSLPRVTSRNGILTFTITDLHLLDTQCHTCCMAQCNDLLQPMSIISAASMTAPAASTAAMTQTVVPTSATANSTLFQSGTMVMVCSHIWA